MTEWLVKLENKRKKMGAHKNLSPRERGLIIDGGIDNGRQEITALFGRRLNLDSEGRGGG